MVFLGHGPYSLSPRMVFLTSITFSHGLTHFQLHIIHTDYANGSWLYKRVMQSGGPAHYIHVHARMPPP